MAVNSTATLGGAGAITTGGNGAVTFASGAKLSPGNLTAGRLTLTLGTGQLNVAADGGTANAGVFAIDLGTTSDRLVLSTGVLNIGSGILGFEDFAFTAQTGFKAGTYALFDSNSLTVGLLDPTQFSSTINGLPATLSTLSDTGRDLTLIVVPETGTWTLLVLGSLTGLRMARHRRRTTCKSGLC